MKDKDRLFQFPFFPADFLVSTMLMTPAEVGGYMRLLCHSWLEDGIPWKSKSHIARLAGVSTSKLEQILIKFYIDDEKRLRHPRLEAVRKEVIALRDKRVKAGRIGGLASKQSSTIAEAKGKQKSSTAQPSKTKQNKAKHITPQTPLGTADRIGLEHAQKLIAEEIKTILNGRCLDATGDVINWSREDDPNRLRELREQEREIKSTLMSFSPREQQHSDIPPGIAGIAELLARGKKSS